MRISDNHKGFVWLDYSCWCIVWFGEALAFPFFVPGVADLGRGVTDGVT